MIFFSISIEPEGKDCGVGVSSFSFVVAFNVQVYLEKSFRSLLKHNLVPFFFLLYLITIVEKTNS